MTKLKYLVPLLALLITSACTQKEEAEVVTDLALDSTEKRVNYGVGYDFGLRLKQDSFPLDVDTFSLGLRQAYEGTERLISEEEVGQEMQAYQEAQNAARADEIAAAAEENASAGAAFLAENAKADGVVVLDSGLQYKVLVAADGAKPSPEDVVEVNYRGTLIDGTEFDSSYARNSSVSFTLNQVIPGWTEALQLMSVGSKHQIFIPPNLGYGENGAGADIGPNSTLIFEVELLQITAAADATD